jgi:hypothetical protein
LIASLVRLPRGRDRAPSVSVEAGEMLLARGCKCANQVAASCRCHDKVARSFLSGPGFSLSSEQTSWTINGVCFNLARRALLNSSPHVPSHFGPQARAKSAWGAALSMSETPPAIAPSQIALDDETAEHWAWRKLISFALLLVSQFVGHRLCAHRRNAERCLAIDLVSVGDRIDVLINCTSKGRRELGD